MAATAVVGTHPTGMHSCSLDSKNDMKPQTELEEKVGVVVAYLAKKGVLYCVILSEHKTDMFPNFCKQVQCWRFLVVSTAKE